MFVLIGSPERMKAEHTRPEKDLLLAFVCTSSHSTHGNGGVGGPKEQLEKEFAV